ncbi:MAG: cob(I)alamin adenosyltransferase [Candidatus Omnitrophota bacterium]|jgi:cob(I)alamin adenosyltransferase
MNVKIVEYLDEKPRLEHTWRGDLVSLLDAFNDDLIDAKVHTKNHVIHSRLSEVQHVLEDLSQEFLNTEKNKYKQMGYGFLVSWKNKIESYTKSHAESKDVLVLDNHVTYKSLVKAKRLARALSKTINLLVETKKFRNFIVGDWFALISDYFNLLLRYEKLN